METFDFILHQLYNLKKVSQTLSFGQRLAKRCGTIGIGSTVSGGTYNFGALKPEVVGTLLRKWSLPNEWLLWRAEVQLPSASQDDMII